MNKELETSKKEPQSLNEELSTANAQLREKVDELEASNNDLSNLLTSTNTVTLFLAPDHTIRRFTPASTRLFKLIASDMGRPLSDIGWRFTDPNLESDIDTVLRSFTPRECEINCDDGRWYVRRITPYRTLDNRIEGVAVTFADISAQKKAAAALEALNTELETRVAERTRELQAERNFATAVLETAAVLVVVVDRGGRVVRWNKACEQASGYSAEDILGQTVLDRVVPPREVDEVKRVFEELRAGQFPNRHENHWRHRDGSCRLIAWSNTCLRDAGGEVEYIIGTGVDVTEQRKSGEEVRKRRLELAHLHRVYTAGEFATVMAHELNQPLAAISSYSEAGLQGLRRGQVDVDAVVHDFEQIGLQAQRAGQSIRELRRFLSRDDHTRECVDLNEIFRAVKLLLEPEARARGVRLELTLSETPLNVEVAPIQIEHVLVNLMRNAIEAIRDAGSTDGTITVGTAVTNGQVRITVQDNGPGFDEAARAHLFERFYTTKPEGLGMGLVICQSIIEGHDGKIWAESPPQGGAAFHFTLPLRP